MKIRKELWFGFIIMGLIVAGTLVMLVSAPTITNGHLGLIMLGLVVVAIMLGFPTAFTLMGMGMFFGWLAYRSANPELAVRQVLDLMVQRAYSVMSNDVLISIPLFVFMGYLVERANLIAKLFRALELALARLPGALAVATLVTCAIFATATGIVGAVVTLMGLLAFPAMLKSGYDVRLSAGVITAGGCLGILIPPSIPMLVYVIVFGQTQKGGDWAVPIAPDGSIAYDVMLSDPVTTLFIAGVGPGILIGSLLARYSMIIGKMDKVPTTPFSWSRFQEALGEGFWALMLPILLMGGIYSGTFTVTQSAAIAVVYSFLV